MTDIAKLIEEDRANPARCFFHGQTPLGGTDACRPELAEDGSILLRSLNLSHTVYRVTEDEYRELRKHPQRKVGMWEFVSDNDPDADNVAYATRSPQGAGRRIGSLEREVATLTEERDRIERNRDMWKGQVERQAEQIASLREALTLAAQSAGFQYMTSETRAKIDAALERLPASRTTGEAA